MSRKSGIRATDNDKKIEFVSQEDNNPLPPVEQLEKLHSFRPDLVDKVIDFCTEETKHRRQLEKDQFEFFKSETRINRWIVSIIIILCLAITLILGILGMELSALAPCFIPIALLITKLFNK